MGRIMGDTERRTIGAAGRAPVVVVDDDPAIVEGLGLLLEVWGHPVLTAGSLTELAERLAGMTERPALVIADHHLPGGTGADAVDLVRGRHGGAVPAILLTGDATPERRAEAASHGFRLLLKPVQPEALQGVILELVGG